MFDDYIYIDKYIYMNICIIFIKYYNILLYAETGIQIKVYGTYT